MNEFEMQWRPIIGNEHILSCDGGQCAWIVNRHIIGHLSVQWSRRHRAMCRSGKVEWANTDVGFGMVFVGSMFVLVPHPLAPSWWADPIPYDDVPPKEHVEKMEAARKGLSLADSYSSVGHGLVRFVAGVLPGYMRDGFSIFEARHRSMKEAYDDLTGMIAHANHLFATEPRDWYDPTDMEGEAEP